MKNPRNPSLSHRLLIQLSLLGLGASLVGCSDEASSGAGQQEWAVSSIIAPVKIHALEEKIFLVGSLASIEEVDLVSEIDARVTEINFDEGQPVQEGQVLVRLDDRKLVAAVAEARSRYDLARTDLDRNASLLERESISQQDFDRAEAEADSAKAQLDLVQDQLEDATIKAPFDGVMTERMISLGQYLTRGQILASLVQVNPLEVQFNVPERYIGELQSGQQIEISIEAWPDESFTGKVVFISPRVDRDSRTILVKALIDNPDGRLKPGMFGQLNLVFRTKEDALVIPEAAISYTGDQAMVVVMNDEKRAEFRTVQVGLRMAGEAEILDGLSEGERVVVEGYQKMGPNSLIRISGESAKYGIEVEGE